MPRPRRINFSKATLYLADQTLTKISFKLEDTVATAKNQMGEVVWSQSVTSSKALGRKRFELTLVDESVVTVSGKCGSCGG